MGKGKIVKEAVDEVTKMILGGFGAAPTPVRKAKVAPKRGAMLIDPQRSAFPGIYDRPDRIAAEAARRVAPEDPAMKSLFGVTREELYDQSRGFGPGNESMVPFAAKPRGSEAAFNIMTPRNTQRLMDVLAEAEKYPELTRGMDSWYNLAPMELRMRELASDPGDRADDITKYLGMASPGSNVDTEINRGSAARYLAERGRFDDFVKYGGQTGMIGAPDDMAGVMGHAYHSTAHVTPMRTLAETGRIEMGSPKVPAYIQASLPEARGGSLDTPVGDAHWSRAVGLADTRKSPVAETFAASVSTPELQSLRDWWRKIGKSVDLLPVPAQARLWGTMSHATGVDSPVGAPKLELIAQRIMRTAKARGESPEHVRDQFLLGNTYLGDAPMPPRRGVLDQRSLEEYYRRQALDTLPF